MTKTFTQDFTKYLLCKLKSYRSNSNKRKHFSFNRQNKLIPRSASIPWNQQNKAEETIKKKFTKGCFNKQLRSQNEIKYFCKKFKTRKDAHSNQSLTIIRVQIIHVLRVLRKMAIKQYSLEKMKISLSLINHLLFRKI